MLEVGEVLEPGAPGSFIGCGRCRYCTHDLRSLCDGTHTNPGIGQVLFRADTGGLFGRSHTMGGLRGTHTEYVRVPFAGHGAFSVPHSEQHLRRRAARTPLAALRSVGPQQSG
ncbi:hypothetical protein [Streptomyces sp. NPDC012466]|jgi:threonine dehydrogenase-like Zn-dependent dehydrogenase|uniref:hypothetical protein n=1 Tax=Streptomyces sp. NPDC012466 TaxID=3364835 RepID=UPI0036E14E40